MSTIDNTKFLVTELAAEKTDNLDLLSAFDIVRLMNEQDYEVPKAVASCLGPIASAIDRIVECLGAGGRLFYIGAGTSGRLGMLDAYECPPTFGTDPSIVQSLLAGNLQSLIGADEEAEDDQQQGAEHLKERQLRPVDAVVGISASGRTPYVLGALQYARGIGALTVSLCCNEQPVARAFADLSIEVPVGPEILTGSTRLKAGTAQKMVLNMISTAVMVRLGKVYRNFMVDLQPSNGKLRARAKRMVAETTGAGEEAVALAMSRSGYRVKVSIVMLLAQVDVAVAEEMLAQTKGSVRQALESVSKETGGRTIRLP